MTAMRRAESILALSAFSVVLVVAPFIHTHIGGEHSSTIPPGGSLAPAPHIHLPEGHGSSRAEHPGHADLDHSSPETKPFLLLAELTKEAFRAPGMFAAPAPVSIQTPLAPIGPAFGPRAPATHDPPARGHLALRAPPASHSI
jgi:hypothetical protein